jgi:hypothetical protein
VLCLAWNSLAEWPVATRALPFLLRYAEDERETFTMIAGAIIGVIAVIQTCKAHPAVGRQLATELSKVVATGHRDQQYGGGGRGNAIATVYVASSTAFGPF